MLGVYFFLNEISPLLSVLMSLILRVFKKLYSIVFSSCLLLFNKILILLDFPFLFMYNLYF